MDLKKMFEEIDEFQKIMGYDIECMPPIERIEYARQCTLALFQEVAELADSFQFADWKKTVTDKDNLTREVIDCFFFLHHICRCFDIAEEDLAVKFEAVMNNNYRRYGQ